MLASFQYADALLCYDCTSSSNANCAAQIVDTTGLPVCTAAAGGSCVTFINKYDNNGIINSLIKIFCQIVSY